jgi:valyl-tRNA synthetase
MLHPFMPFVTEELWGAMGQRPYELILAKWPAPEVDVDANAKAEIDWLIETTEAFRRVRADLNIPYSTKLTPRLVERSERDEIWLDRHFKSMMRLVGLNTFMVAGRKALHGNFEEDPEIAFDSDGNAVLTRNAAQVVAGDATYILPLDGLVDLQSEKSRLEKLVAAAERDRDGLAARLDNPAFAERAKPEAVEKARADHAERAAEAERLAAALARLG